MALTPSKMIPLQTKAPYFELPEPLRKIKVSLNEKDLGSPVLVMFICNHCPYVKHIKRELSELASEFQQKGFKIFAINSNDSKNYPDDSPEKMVTDATNFRYSFPYLFDETQEVARAYQAACTPDFFVFDRDHKLTYCGQFDSSRPNSAISVTGNDLRKAMDAVLEGKKIDFEPKPSMGCNVKLRY